MRAIDYDKILFNINGMINTLEFDSMRSGGKVKQACVELDALYRLKDRYEADKKKSAPAPKPTPKKEG